MTREQAINYLFSSGFTNEQVCDVVRALTYEPTTKNNLGVDCISRADAIRVASGYCHPSNVAKELAKLPSVTPQLSVPEVTALAEWTTKLTEANEDAYNKGYEAGMKAQEPRKGHWLRRPHVYGVTYCSVCDFELKIDNTNYCPNCGAKMKSEVEDGND